MPELDYLLLLLLALCALGSWAGTGLVRRYALARSLLDVPNDRSSHAVPTPRGGGLAIAIALLAGFLGGGVLGLIEWRVALALVGGGLLVAGIGWIDDHSHVAARWRSLVHFIAAIWAVALLGGLNSLRLGPVELPLGIAGSALAVVGIVWLVNLYNFMDGIDGIAGGEATVVALLGGALAWYAGAPAVAVCAALVAAAAAGFLAWNWPPAKIFMGDVGSGLLGFLFAVIAIASENRGGPPLLVWGILLGVFLFDATATLIRRVLRGEQWYSAHRSHAYQRAVQSGWSHGRVSGGVQAINLLLGLIALVGVIRPPLLPFACGTALLLLSGVYLWIERIRPMDPPRSSPVERPDGSGG
jgi:Fuc2NAc and GlcNAc transferase